MGDNFSVNVTVTSNIPPPPDDPNPFRVIIGSKVCQQITETMCTGTSGDSIDYMEIFIDSHIR
jgi:hypothetical protein